MSNVINISGLANEVRVGIIQSIDSEKCTAIVSLSEITATITSASTSSSSSSSSSSSTSDSIDLQLKLSTAQVHRTVRTLTRGSKTFKDYFNYEVGEPVVCIFPAQIASNAITTSTTGYIVGTFFDYETLDRKPPAFYEKVRMLEVPGASIVYNSEDKELSVECEGDISINGKNIYLNG